MQRSRLTTLGESAKAPLNVLAPKYMRRKLRCTTSCSDLPQRARSTQVADFRGIRCRVIPKEFVKQQSDVVCLMWMYGCGVTSGSHAAFDPDDLSGLSEFSRTTQQRSKRNCETHRFGEGNLFPPHVSTLLDPECLG